MCSFRAVFPNLGVTTLLRQREASYSPLRGVVIQQGWQEGGCHLGSHCQSKSFFPDLLAVAAEDDTKIWFLAAAAAESKNLLLKFPQKHKLGSVVATKLSLL